MTTSKAETSFYCSFTQFTIETDYRKELLTENTVTACQVKPRITNKISNDQCLSHQKHTYSKNVSPVQEQSRKVAAFKVSFYGSLSIQK
jgi:hypothetical protein